MSSIFRKCVRFICDKQDINRNEKLKKENRDKGFPFHTNAMNQIKAINSIYYTNFTPPLSFYNLHAVAPTIFSLFIKNIYTQIKKKCINKKKMRKKAGIFE